MANDLIKLVKEKSVWIVFIILFAGISGGFTYVINGNRKAREAAGEATRNTKAIEKITDTLHKRISKNHNKIDETTKLVIRVDERTKNFKEFWEFYEGMNK